LARTRTARRRERARQWQASGPAESGCCEAPRPFDRPHGLYRSRDGVIFGVCGGLAEYLNFPVFWMRVLAICAMFFTGFWPLIAAYVVAAFLMKPEPIVEFKEESDQEFYESYVNSRTMALSRLKRTFDNLERRIRRMENLVTARDYDWERRLNEKA
jgi:phage shock protein C